MKKLKKTNKNKLKTINQPHLLDVKFKSYVVSMHHNFLCIKSYFLPMNILTM